jgi:hypothetical protein
MKIREQLIRLLGGELPDEGEPQLTGDPCIDEGHDVLEVRSATQRDPISRRCRVCQQWLDAHGDPIP